MKLTPKQLEVVLNTYREMSYKDLTLSDFEFLKTHINDLKKIYSSIKYDDLTELDKQILTRLGVFNGYGGARSSWLVRKLTGIICARFKRANSEKHDYGFWIGGDIERFYECNRKFLSAMLEDSTILKGFSKYFFTFIAFFSYIAVDTLGKKHFDFTEKSI